VDAGDPVNLHNPALAGLLMRLPELKRTQIYCNIHVYRGFSLTSNHENPGFAPPTASTYTSGIAFSGSLTVPAPSSNF
jgi:hypothetical protein